MWWENDGGGGGQTGEGSGERLKKDREDCGGKDKEEEENGSRGRVKEEGWIYLSYFHFVIVTLG